MSKRYLYVLQSGFVTTASLELVKSLEPDRTLRDNLFVQDTRVVDTDNYYDEGVEELFTLVRKDESVMKQFDVREQLLATAYRVFDRKSPVEWIIQQYDQRTVGYLHYKFLKEMLDRANNWEMKTLDNNQYFRLLSASEAARQQPGADKMKLSLIQYLKNCGNDRSLDAILTQWTRDMHGFMDLLQSLHVIFGRRYGLQSGLKKAR